MIPSDALTVGQLRNLLADAPDRDHVMLCIDGHSAAWARVAEHDPEGRTFDILAGRLPIETLAPRTAALRALRREV